MIRRHVPALLAVCVISLLMVVFRVPLTQMLINMTAFVGHLREPICPFCL